MNDLERAKCYLDDASGDGGKTEHVHKQAQILAQIAQAQSIQDLVATIKFLEISNRSIAESMFNLLDVLREISGKLEK